MSGWVMTPQALRRVCQDNDGYAHAPELNDVLHLHGKGIGEVENLEPYTGLKTLYLESNSIDVLDGLVHLSLLRCLYMAKNALSDVHGVSRLTALVTLDISENHVDSLEGLRGHPTITTLLASGNRLLDMAGIDALSECPQLTSLDLTDNKIDDPEVINFLTGNSIDSANSKSISDGTTEETPKLHNQLKLLKFRGNPVVSETPSYRKLLTANIKNLNYLDDSPVFPKDRRLAEAWAVGGVEAEQAERTKIFEDERVARELSAQKFNAMVTAAKLEAERKRLNGEQPVSNPYRFMSTEAAREAKLMLEDNVPEWRIEEMRAQESFPWQVEERERKEKEERDIREKELEETRRLKEEVTALRVESVWNSERLITEVMLQEVLKIVEEVVSEEVVMVGTDSMLDTSTENKNVPVAQPMNDDGPTPGIFIAQIVASDENDLKVYDPEAFALELELATAPGAYSDKRTASRKKELERHALATSAAGAGAGGWAPGVERVTNVKRSPVVYGTDKFNDLWSQAKALGEVQEAEELGGLRVESGDENEDLDAVDVDVDSDFSSSSNSMDLDSDPFERHSVVTNL